jgi:hypothetical protein
MLLNSTVINSPVLYGENTGKMNEELSFRAQLAGGIFVKYRTVVVHKVSGRHSCDNATLLLTERHFVVTIPPADMKTRAYRRCMWRSYRGKRKNNTTRERTGTRIEAWTSNLNLPEQNM